MGKDTLGFLKFGPPLLKKFLEDDDEKPKVSGDAAKSLEADKRKAKRSRSSLLATRGGIAGEEVGPGGITNRTSIFGN